MIGYRPFLAVTGPHAPAPWEVHAAVFDRVLVLIAEAGLIKGERIGVDASTMEANAALRNIVRRDNGEGYREMLERLARDVAAVETPTAAGPGASGPEAQGQGLSNSDWVSKSDPEAKIGRMKDGIRRMGLQARARGGVMDTGLGGGGRAAPGR